MDKQCGNCSARWALSLHLRVFHHKTQLCSSTAPDFYYRKLFRLQGILFSTESWNHLFRTNQSACFAYICLFFPSLFSFMAHKRVSSFVSSYSLDLTDTSCAHKDGLSTRETRRIRSSVYINNCQIERDKSVPTIFLYLSTTGSNAAPAFECVELLLASLLFSVSHRIRLYLWCCWWRWCVSIFAALQPLEALQNVDWVKVICLSVCTRGLELLKKWHVLIEPQPNRIVQILNPFTEPVINFNRTIVGPRIWIPPLDMTLWSWAFSD